MGYTTHGAELPDRNEQGASMTRTPITLMFTDLAGSSAAKRAESLGADAIARDRAYIESILKKYLRLIRSAVASHNGREVMTIGDAFFLTFQKSIDAIRCAAVIQQRLEAEPILTPTGPMQLRIGIHVGTPEYFENSWHGTDVDIAARTECAGLPGQIVVTEAARVSIGNPGGIQFRSLGTFALKGVGKVRLWNADYDQRRLRKAAIASIEQKLRRRIITSVAIIIGMIALAGDMGWRQSKAAADAGSTARRSIFLNDFENKTGDPVFDTALNDTIAAQIEQSPALKLISRQHLRQSIGRRAIATNAPLSPADLREAGMREGVETYLDGSIARLGNHYVVTMSARDISTGDDIVSETAQARDKDHVLDALDKVATSIRSRLGESLTSRQQLAAPRDQTSARLLNVFQDNGNNAGYMKLFRHRSNPQMGASWLPWPQLCLNCRSLPN